MFQKIFERFPVHQDNPTRFLEDGQHGGGGDHVCNGATAGRNQEVSFDAVDIFDVADGRIYRLSQWFDTAALAAMLGG